MNANTTTSAPLAVTWDDVASAAERLRGVAHHTPVMTSGTLNEKSGVSLFFKCENLQLVGAFKFRGAYNAMTRLTDDEKRRGVVTFSSGNHGQAIALCGTMLQIPTVVIMPADAPAVKIAGTRQNGAEVILYNREGESREQIAARVQGERGMTLIPPFDHPHIIAGQGTAAIELIEEAGKLDCLYVCVGGGGLISGCAIAANHLSPGCQVVGVEPEAGDDATRSFHSGVLQTVHNPDTIADGARTASLGKLTFPLIRRHVHDMMTVSDPELARAMFLLWEQLHVVVEPTGALAAAGALKRAESLRGKRVGVIVSGGNADLSAVAALRAVADR
jgi:threonine dehydratase